MEGNCEVCSTFRKWLHKHHEKLQVEGGKDEDGTRLVCANCHEDIHGGPCGGVERGRTSLSPSARKKKAVAAARLWNDPKYRKKVAAGQRRAIKKKDYKAIGRKIAAAWTPERRKAHAKLLSRIKRKQLAGRWSFKYKCCRKCKTTKVPHRGKGFCERCYMRRFMREQHAERAKKLFASSLAYRRLAEPGKKLP